MGIPLMESFPCLFTLTHYGIYCPKHLCQLFLSVFMQIIKGHIHTEDMIYQLRFGDDNLYLSISTTSKCAQIPYSNNTEIIESKNLYLL